MLIVKHFFAHGKSYCYVRRHDNMMLGITNANNFYQKKVITKSDVMIESNTDGVASFPIQRGSEVLIIETRATEGGKPFYLVNYKGKTGYQYADKFDEVTD